MAATSFSGVSRTGARRSLGVASPFAATEPGGFATCETAFSPVMATTAIASILTQTTQLKKRVRFILQSVYRFGCIRQVATGTTAPTLTTAAEPFAVHCGSRSHAAG